MGGFIVAAMAGIYLTSAAKEPRNSDYDVPPTTGG